MSLSFTRDESGITIRQGDTAVWAYQLWEDEVDGVKPDTTDWDCRLMVRSTFNSSTPLLTLNVTNGKIVNDNTGGFTVSIAPADTAYAPGSGIRVVGDQLDAVFDVEIQRDDGTVFTVDAGAFVILREVTREY